MTRKLLNLPEDVFRAPVLSRKYGAEDAQAKAVVVAGTVQMVLDAVGLYASGSLTRETLQSRFENLVELAEDAKRDLDRVRRDATESTEEPACDWCGAPLYAPGTCSRCEGGDVVKTIREGRAGGRWPDYALVDAETGVTLGRVVRKLPAVGAMYSHDRADGWLAAGVLWETREKAEAALVLRAGKLATRKEVTS